MTLYFVQKRQKWQFILSNLALMVSLILQKGISGPETKFHKKCFRVPHRLISPILISIQYRAFRVPDHVSSLVLTRLATAGRPQQLRNTAFLVLISILFSYKSSPAAELLGNHPSARNCRDAKILSERFSILLSPYLSQIKYTPFWIGQIQIISSFVTSFLHVALDSSQILYPVATWTK